MPKSPRPAFRCSECGWETGKWVGRCGECQAWGSVAETAVATVGRTAAAPVTAKAVPIGEVSVEQSAYRSSGVPELDRVLGGGLVPGAVILLAGEPGVGKSTLLLEVAAQTARYQRRALYVSGEESASQVRLRADRTEAVQPELYIAAETDLGAVLTHIEETKPELLVVDSVQTIGAAGVDGVPGGVAQVKEVAAALVRTAKTRNITTVLVGHVTKDGSFDLSSDGITAVTDPTGLFVERHHQPVSGTCVAVTMEGRRPMLAEVQALVTASALDRPRRTTSGLDGSRVAMVLAVLQRHCGYGLAVRDIFASTVGGARLSEPASDLAVAVALASATTGDPTPPGVVAMGEIGLAGELRRGRDLPQRLAEAARLGFSVAVVPAEPGERSATPRERRVDGMRVFELGDVRSALEFLRLTTPVRESHRRAHRARLRQDGRLDLDRRLPARRAVHVDRSARAGEDGRRAHPRLEHQPDHQGRRTPDARPHA